MMVMRWLERRISRRLFDGASGRLRSIASAFKIATFAIFAVRLSFVTFLFAAPAGVTTGLGAIAELTFPFLGVRWIVWSSLLSRLSLICGT
jgi:hypothetical protein